MRKYWRREGKPPIPGTNGAVGASHLRGVGKRGFFCGIERKEMEKTKKGKNIVNNCELFLHWGESPFIMRL